MGRTGLLVFLLLAASPVRAAELVLFETPSCPWCIKWHHEIGAHYSATKAGHLLPLRRVDMLQPLPAEIAALPHVAVIPTFVIVECGQEVGRVVGYTGEGSFWNELANALSEARRPDGC